jgi:hypothetical protein
LVIKIGLNSPAKPLPKSKSYSLFFFSTKPSRCSNISNLFLDKIIHVSGSSSAHHQESLTGHSALVCVMQVLTTAYGRGPYHTGFLTACEQEQMLLLTSCQQTCMRYLTRSSASKLPAGNITTSSNTQSSAPEDGQNNCPKHVELIGITNKPLLLHLFGCLYYYINTHSQTNIKYCMYIAADDKCSSSIFISFSVSQQHIQTVS